MTPGSSSRQARYLPRLPALWTSPGLSPAGRERPPLVQARQRQQGVQTAATSLLEQPLREGGFCQLHCETPRGAAEPACLPALVGKTSVALEQQQEEVEEEEQLRGCRLEQHKRLHFFSSHRTFFIDRVVSAISRPPPPPHTHTQLVTSPRFSSNHFTNLKGGGFFLKRLQPSQHLTKQSILTCLHVNQPPPFILNCSL